MVIQQLETWPNAESNALPSLTMGDGWQWYISGDKDNHLQGLHAPQTQLYADQYCHKTIIKDHQHIIFSYHKQLKAPGMAFLQKAHSINLKGVKLTWLIIIVISTCASCSCMVYPLIYGAINAHLSLWCRIQGHTTVGRMSLSPCQEFRGK